MAQTRVFSWKIDGNSYGYLYIPPGKSGDKLISNRITDDAVLTEISNVIANWTESEYTTKFNELNSAIRAKFGVSIPGSASDYFNGYVKNYIVLTGKDGGYSKKQTNTVSEETAETIKKLVNSELAKAKKELKADVESVKESTISTVNSKINAASSEMVSLKNELIANENAMSAKLDSAQSKIDTAAQLFDMNGTGVNKQNLQNAITKSNAAIERLNVTDGILSEQSASIRETNERLTNETSQINGRITEVESSTEELERAVNTIGSTVSELNIRVERISSASIEMQQEEQQSTNLRSAMPDNEETALTETIDNGDGSFNINTTIGNENYNVKIYGYGGKIKVREVEDGLVLATNGFRYKDKSGSIISMINGNILLSNADGSGKLEIKKDGLYINGNKQ